MKLVFDIELTNELDGTFMNFEYEHEIWEDDYTEQEIAELISELETGKNYEIYDTVLSNISINPRFSYKED